MVAAPLLALISLELVPGPMLLINFVLSLLMLSSDRSLIDRDELSVLLPMVGAGTILAAIILASLPATLFGILFALIILAAVIVSVFSKPITLSSKTLATGGVLAGLMGTISGVSGPPMAVLYQHEELQKTRSTLAVVFSFSYMASLIALSFAGKFNIDLALEGLKLFPGLLLGYLVATKHRALVSQSVGRRLTLSIAAISSIILLLDSL